LKDGEPIMTVDQKLLMTAKETAKHLNISLRKLSSITQPNGDLPVVRIDRRLGYRKEAVEQWLKDKESKTSDNNM